MSEKKYKCSAPGCDRSFSTAQQRKGHLLSHVTEDQLMSLFPQGVSSGPQESLEEPSVGSSSRKEVDVTEESKPEADLAKAIQEGFKGLQGDFQGVQSRLGKVETDVGDFCSKFPELCNRVESIEKGMTSIGEVRVPTIEAGSDEWKGRRKADLDHMLFGDCPDCGPLRDEILQAKGKRLADVEPDVEPKVETDVDQKVEAPELETSTHPKRGFKWDWDKRLYVKKQEGGGE